MLDKLLKSTTAKYLLAIIVIALIIMIALSIVLSDRQTPTTSTQDFVPSPEQPNLTLPPKGDPAKKPIAISFVGDRDIEKKSAGVYSAEKNAQSQAGIMLQTNKTIIERYELASVYDEEGVAIYTSNKHTLLINLSENTIDFSRNQTAKTETSISLNQAIDVAQDFFSIVLPNQNLSPVAKGVQFFKGKHHLEPATQMAASIISIPFSNTLESIPIYEGYKESPFVLIMINSNLQVQKATIQPSVLSAEKIFSKELLSLDDALGNIGQRINSELISFAETDELLTQEPNLDRITHGTLASVRLEYRVEPKQNLIYPFYRFEGELTDADGVTFKGEIITPAVSLER